MRSAVSELDLGFFDRLTHRGSNDQTRGSGVNSLGYMNITGEALPGGLIFQGFGGALLAGGGPPVQHFDFAGEASSSPQQKADREVDEDLVVATACIILVAGYDTTAVGMSTCLWLLARQL